MRKILKISWIILRSIIILILLSYTTCVIVEHISKDVLVNDFISKGVYQEELSTRDIKYYKIAYDGAPTMYYDEITHDCYPGGKGDILVSPDQLTIAPIVNEIVSFYAGGHAGYSIGNYEDYVVQSMEYNTLEITQTLEVHNARLYHKKDWACNEYFNVVIGLRVDMTEEEYEKVTSVILSYYDDPYNSSFLFNTTNSKYCTDMMSQAFSYIGKNLNRDSFSTSVFDLIVSQDTYISYYHYYDGNGVKHVYYLG